MEGYYKNGKLAYQDEFRDGKLYKNGQLASGVFEYFYEGGHLKDKFNYQDGELHGLSEHYYENGQLSSKSNYKDGKEHGLQESFNKDGSLKYSSKYENGMKVSD